MNVPTKLAIFVAGLAMLFVLPQTSHAQGDIGKGKIKAQGCAACHNAGRLDLAGKDAAALSAAMMAMKKGTKKHPPVFGSLDDADIGDIAAYLSSIKR